MAEHVLHLDYPYLTSVATAFGAYLLLALLRRPAVAAH
jgi:hypothetical protein